MAHAPWHTAVDSLTPSSDKTFVQQAINESVAQCTREGKSEVQCTAQVMEIVRRKTGAGVGGEGARTIRVGLEQETNST
jgi:hypothetical protein